MTTIMCNALRMLGVGLVLAAGTAHAQPTKESLKCSSSKLKLYGKDAVSKTKCYSKALGKGEPVDPECLLKAETKASEGFAKLEAKGGCPVDAGTAGGIAAILVDINAYVDLVQTSLTVNPLNKCQSKKVGAVSKLAGALLNCEAKAASKNVAVDQVKCVDKAVQKTVDGFAKEEAKGPCDTTGDAAFLIGETQDFVRLIVVDTPRFDGCGNRLVTGTETCDDGNAENFDFCPTDCTVDFCETTATTQQVTVVSSTPDLAGIEINLDYPEGRVSLQGVGGDIPPGLLTGPGTATIQGNDFDHALRIVIADAFNFGTTSVATIQFNTCSGAPAPVPGDFACAVTSANDETSAAVAAVTCSVTVP